jgi:hypothetical protein
MAPLRAGLQPQLDHDILPELPAGAVGLSRVIRSWHAVSFDVRRSPAILDRFAGLIGYRLLELAESGREADVAAVLRVLGGSAGYSDGALLLGHLAEGLERYGYQGLAAQAHALAWTRARGGGGWLNFGGETALDALRNAARLDPVITADLVAEETERVVASGRYGTYGVTEALIIAFAARALGVAGSDPVDTAFAMWEEARAVINDRTPRVDDTDDPDQPYAAPQPDDGSRTPGDLDVAFAAAALAGFAHASLESKRRSLLAAQALITQRPGIAGPAVATALAVLSDPATLTWLLCLISDQGVEGKTVARHCEPQLWVLAQGPYLTVRAIARRLLPPESAAALPLGPSDAGLLMSPGSTLWVPQASDDDDGAPTELVRGVAGARLVDAQPLAPGLAEAVLRRVVTDSASPELKSRMKDQLRAYRDTSIRDHWPDAYLAVEQIVEEALQRTAAGARSARIAVGLLSADPAGREDELATALTDLPQIPLALEAARYPRPLIPAPPRDNSPIWAEIAAAARGVPSEPATVFATRAVDGKLMATVSVQSATIATVIDGGPYDDWCVIGTAERLACQPRHYGDGTLFAYRYSALEVREEGNRERLDSRPLAVGDIREWTDPLPGPHVPSLINEPQPLLAIDHPTTSSLGLAPQVLVPIGLFAEALGLRPGKAMTLDDDAGPGLALITWRTCYKQSDYYLAWPRLTGCAVVIRPDLLPRLTSHLNASLVMRGFVAGDEALAESDSSNA